VPFTMSSTRSRLLAPAESGNPDENYDIFDYEEEISDDDTARAITEGILRQEDQPQAPKPKRHPYAEKISKLMKRGAKAENISEQDVAGPSRRLVSHDQITSLSPELAVSFDKKGANCPKDVPFIRRSYTNHFITEQSPSLPRGSRSVQPRTWKHLRAFFPESRMDNVTWRSILVAFYRRSETTRGKPGRWRDSWSSSRRKNT
jgi:hypothetical protein